MKKNNTIDNDANIIKKLMVITGLLILFSVIGSSIAMIIVC